MRSKVYDMALTKKGQACYPLQSVRSKHTSTAQFSAPLMRPLTRAERSVNLARYEAERKDSRPTVGQAYRAEPMRRRQRLSRFAGITPGRLSRVIGQLEQGETEDWASICEFMLRTDGHIRGVWESRLLALAGGELIIDPADDSPEAQESANLCRDAFDAMDGFVGLITHLGSARGIGPAISEHDWKIVRGQWVSVDPVHLQHRDVAWDEQGGLVYRTWLYDNERWFRVDDAEQTNPDLLMCTKPRTVGLAPHLAADLLPVAWLWLWKRWAMVWRNEAIERHAAPFTVGYLDENASNTAANTMADGLETLTSNGYAVIRKSAGGVGEIELIQPQGNVDDNFRSCIADLNAEISKAILGSTLNTEIGEAGGNRAAAESQAATTITPRIEADARSVEQVLLHQWFKPVLKYNAHKLSGAPRLPRIQLQLTTPKAKETLPGIMTLAVGAGVVKKNELRTAAGLLPDESFDDDIVKPTLPGGDFQPAPFAEPEAHEHTHLCEHDANPMKPFADYLHLSEEDKQAADLDIGKPRRLVVEGRARVVPHLREQVRDFVRQLSEGGDTEQALADLKSSLDDDDFAERVIYETRMRTAMAGHLFVDKFELKTKFLSRFNESTTFLSLPFQEAVEEFIRRTGLTEEDFLAMSDAERVAAFRAVRAYNDQVVRNMERAIEASIARADAPDDRSFIREFESTVEAGDLPGGNRGYVENVFRTASSTAYNAGRLRRQQAAGVTKYQYLAVEDDRTRASHRALSGRVFSADDPELQQVYPPNGYQCRCIVIAAEDEDEVTGTEGLDMNGFFDEPSFRRPPTE